jgi:outer membrane lipoprotein LolB
MRVRCRIAALPALLLLVACTSLQGRAPVGAPDEAAWRQHAAQMAALADWSLSGRVGFINGKDSGSGSLDWRQQGAATTLDFHGPLGAGAIHMEGDAQRLHVQSSRGDDFYTSDPEADLEMRLHQPLPVLSLRYWVLGIPDPGTAYTKADDAHGELRDLDQSGWHVEYQEYADVSGYSLPTRFSLERGPVRIKVAVSAWTLPAKAP